MCMGRVICNLILQYSRILSPTVSSLHLGKRHKKAPLVCQSNTKPCHVPSHPYIPRWLVPSQRSLSSPGIMESVGFQKSIHSRWRSAEQANYFLTVFQMAERVFGAMYGRTRGGGTDSGVVVYWQFTQSLLAGQGNCERNKKEKSKYCCYTKLNELLCSFVPFCFSHLFSMYLFLFPIFSSFIFPSFFPSSLALSCFLCLFSILFFLSGYIVVISFFLYSSLFCLSFPFFTLLFSFFFPLFLLSFLRSLLPCFFSTLSAHLSRRNFVIVIILSWSYNCAVYYAVSTVLQSSCLFSARTSFSKYYFFKKNHYLCSFQGRNPTFGTIKYY